MPSEKFENRHHNRKAVKIHSTFHEKIKDKEFEKRNESEEDREK